MTDIEKAREMPSEKSREKAREQSLDGLRASDRVCEDLWAKWGPVISWPRPTRPGVSWLRKWNRRDEDRLATQLFASVGVDLDDDARDAFWSDREYGQIFEDANGSVWRSYAHAFGFAHIAAGCSRSAVIQNLTEGHDALHGIIVRPIASAIRATGKESER